MQANTAGRKRQPHNWTLWGASSDPSAVLDAGWINVHVRGWLIVLAYELHSPIVREAIADAWGSARMACIARGCTLPK
jgi:hypothetical protein